jgi:uncharacterized damage-inducible protein DinB
VILLLPAQNNSTMSAQKIAQRLEEIYRGEPWFGESLQAKLKTVTEETAYRQPVNNRHSIAEILSHMEFWHKSFIHQLKGDTTTSFTGTSPDNWPDVDTLKKRGWRKLQASFEETHHELVTLLNKVNGKPLSDELMTNLNGMVDHDVYHMGQIGIVKSLITSKG